MTAAGARGASSDSGGETAGQDSPHLDEHEQAQAAEHTAPQALVIHEVLREEGEGELRRANAALLWSGLAAGLSMGFSLLAMALLRSGLSDEPWRRLVEAPGYSVGFVIVVLGRQQLFTETTLTAVLPLMVRRDLATLASLLRMWGVVLAANLIGTIAFACLISCDGVFPEPVRHSLAEIGQEVLDGPNGPKFIKAILAGWLIALMVWLLPSARSARILVILLITYVVAIAQLPHIVAGSADVAYAVWSGHATVADYLWRFLVPTLLGNTVGGVALVTFLNHAPLAAELQDEPPRPAR
ncbi:MAG: formate/nitrite transporter family protein [Geminicoccaceae bacterium]